MTDTNKGAGRKSSVSNANTNSQANETNVNQDQGAQKTAGSEDEGYPKEVVLVTEDAKVKEEEREKKMPLKAAKSLLDYEEKNGFTNWKLKSGQGLTFENGRFSRGNNSEDQNPA